MTLKAFKIFLLFIAGTATAEVEVWDNTHSSSLGDSFSVNSLPATDLLGIDASSYQAYSPQDIMATRLSDSCKTLLSSNLRCHSYVDGFRELRYRGSLPNDTLTKTVCDQGCGTSLGFWFYASQEACRGEMLYGAPATLVPGRLWQGWNETCITDPTTNLNCNYVIEKFPEVESVENMDKAHLCSFCWIRRHEVMRSPYSIYNDYWQHVLQTINSKCGLNKPTSVPSPVILLEEPKPAFCATAQSYITVQGDSCRSIAVAKNLSSSSLWFANQRIIQNCSSIEAGKRLCLPYPCSRQYHVQPGESCDLIEIEQDMFYGTLRRFNPWLNADCSNLQSGVQNMGNVLCITATGGTNFALAPPKVVSQPRSGPRGSS